MAPPVMGQQGNEEMMAKETLERAQKAIDDLLKKGCEVDEAKGWYDQANEMFRGGLYRTSLIYSNYALDAAQEVLQKMKDLLLKITRVKTRANDMLGKDHRDYSKIEELIDQMKVAVKEGRLEECQDLINSADEVLRGGSSPYITGGVVSVPTVAPSRGYSSCPSCGNIVETTWKECQYCGSDLAEGEEEEAAPSGPVWTATTAGPLMISEKRDEMPQEEVEEEEEVVVEETETDKDLSDDVAAMEKVEAEMDKVTQDLERSEDLEEKEEAPPEEKSEEPAEKAEAPPEGSDEEALASCPQCGEEVEPDFIKCPMCKTKLN